MDPADIFLKAADNFGLTLTVLLAGIVIVSVAFVREWVIGGRTHRTIVEREVARGNEFERLFRDSVGLNEEQLKANQKAADIVELIAARIGKRTG